MESNRPKVGVGVMIIKDGKVLVGKRKGSHIGGIYAFPGGHVEYMESFEECVRRETLEETGMEIKNVRFLFLANLKAYPPSHYANIGFMADWESGEPKILEPEKIESWNWYRPDQIPEPFFSTIPYYFEALKTGRSFWDA